MSGEKFVEKRKFALPKETFVVTKLPKEELRKIMDWKRGGDKITIWPCLSTSELVLVNESLLGEKERTRGVAERWRRK